MRQIGSLLLLAVLLCLPLACEPAASNPAHGGNPCLGFGTILPEEWQYITTYSLDTNGDGDQEWVVLYRFDLSVDDKDQYRGPIAGAVYQPDDERPPNLIAHRLHPPDGDYLCECKCVPATKDVLSGLEGLELIVSDRCDDETTRLTIFHWDQDAKTYLPKGHFRGSDIQVGQNEVRVEEPWPGRAQLAMRYTYHSCDNNTTFYQPGGQGVPVQCEKHELVFPHGEPKDVTCSPYFEKVVLAFYNHYTEEKARSYFTEEGWEQLGRCAGSQCGCTSARSEIEHVRVTQLEPQDSNANSNWATVVATVICERRNAAPDAARSIRWNLICKDDRWKLHSVQ